MWMLHVNMCAVCILSNNLLGDLKMRKNIKIVFPLRQGFFLRITQYNEDAHNTHAHSHPMNTRTQTLPLWAPPKDWAPADLKIPEVITGASLSTGTSLNT